MRSLYLFVCLCGIITQSAFAQVDSLFGVAREYAFNGKRLEARKLCDDILKLSPNYADVILLKGRTYSWDGLRDSARLEFAKVLANDSNNTEAWGALADVEFWDDKTQAALDAVNIGLRLVPKTKPLMLKQTTYLIDLARYDEAEQVLKEIRKIDTVCTECKPLEDKLAEKRAHMSVAFGYSADYFQGLNRLFLYQYIQVGNRSPKNSVFFRVNFNQRYQSNGFQPEIDMYPDLNKKNYLYLNYGFSFYSLFPKQRIGIEWYRLLGKGYEGSFGGRYMYFGVGSQVFIFTGSLTKYIGNYAIIARPFITPDPVAKSASASLILNLRRYTIDADNYFGIVGGAGYSPDQRVFLTGASLNTETTSIYYMQAYRFGITWYKTVTFRHVFNIDFDYRYQELKLGGTSDFYHTYSSGVTYKYKF